LSCDNDYNKYLSYSLSDWRRLVILFKCGHREIWVRIESNVNWLSLASYIWNRVGSNLRRYVFLSLIDIQNAFSFNNIYIYKYSVNRGIMSRHQYSRRRSVDQTPTCVIHYILTLGFCTAVFEHRHAPMTY